jgi:flagellar motility protein MotE (MotC chaperone)
MRIKLALIAVLSLAAAFALAALAPAALAQTAPPAAADKPAAPKKPKAAPTEEVASKNVSVAEKAQKCLKIEDLTMDRLNCYDAAVKPQPDPNPPPVKGILDCRHIVDINDRLACFNGFAVQIPKFTH